MNKNRSDHDPSVAFGLPLLGLDWVGDGENKKVNCEAALNHRAIMTPAYFIILGHQKTVICQVCKIVLAYVQSVPV